MPEAKPLVSFAGGLASIGDSMVWTSVITTQAHGALRAPSRPERIISASRHRYIFHRAKSCACAATGTVIGGMKRSRRHLMSHKIRIDYLRFNPGECATSEHVRPSEPYRLDYAVYPRISLSYFGSDCIFTVDIKPFHAYIRIRHNNRKGRNGIQSAPNHEFTPLLIGQSHVVATCSQHIVTPCFHVFSNIKPPDKIHNHRRYSPRIRRESPYHSLIGRIGIKLDGPGVYQAIAFEHENAKPGFLSNAGRDIESIASSGKTNNHRLCFLSAWAARIVTWVAPNPYSLKEASCTSWPL